MLANSLRELAKHIGRSHISARRWVKHRKWNQPRTPPWDVEKAIAWAKETLAPDPNKHPVNYPDPPPKPEESVATLRKNPISAARLKLAVVRAQKLEVEKAILIGEYVPRRDVEIALVRRAHAVRSEFEALPRQLAARLATLSDEEDIERLLEDAVRAALAELSKKPALPPALSLESATG